MRSRSSQSGFTLTELLVVIAIIGILTSIAVPAVMVARGAAIKAACANNLKNLGVAAENYHSDKGNFPPSFYTRTDALGVPYTHNWVITLLPYLEQQKLADDLKDDPSLVNAPLPRLDLLICGADQYDNFDGAISYAANCGRRDSTTPPGSSGDPEMETYYRDPSGKGAGVFYDRRTAAPPYGVYVGSSGPMNPMRIKIDKSDVYDGLGQTILIAERSNPLFGISKAFASSNSIQAPRLNGDTEAEVGLVWRDYSYESYSGATLTDDLTDPDILNGLYVDFGDFVNYSRETVTPYAAATQIDFARPASLHSGGVNVLFCDGTVKTVKSDLDYDIYCKMMTADSREIEDPNGPGGASRSSGAVTDDLIGD